MKIWIVTTDDDHGHATSVVFTKAEADALALDWCRRGWMAHLGDMPWDWQTAREILADDDRGLLYVDEHEVAAPRPVPAAAAGGTVMALDRRQLAAVLAGLRLIQHELGRGPHLPGGVDPIFDDEGEIDPLSEDELDDLCQSINCS